MEVGALVAATCAAGGAQELSSSVLQAWATGFLSSPNKALVATPLQKPPRLQPSARYGLGPDPRPGHRAVPGRRYRASLLLSRALARDAKRRASVGQARTRRRRPSQWTTMTRVAALLRAPPGRRFTRSAPGSVTFVSRSTGQPWKTARPLTRMGESVRGTADPRGAHRPLTLLPSPWMRMWLLAAINGGPIRLPFARSRQRLARSS